MENKQTFTTALCAAMVGGIVITSCIASNLINRNNQPVDNTMIQGEVNASDLFYVEDMIAQTDMNTDDYSYTQPNTSQPTAQQTFGTYTEPSPGEKQQTIEAVVRKQEAYLESIYNMLPSVNVMLEMYYNSAKEYQVKNGKNVTEIGEWIIPTTTNIVHDADLNEKVKARIALDKEFNISEIKSMKLSSYELDKIWIRNTLSQTDSTIEDTLKQADFTTAIDLMTNPDVHLLNYIDNVLREERRLCEAMLYLRDSVGAQYGIVVFGNLDLNQVQTTIQNIDYAYSNFTKIKDTYSSQFIYTLNSDISNLLQVVQQQMLSHNDWYLQAFKAKSNDDLLYIRTQYDLVPAEQRIRQIPTALVPPLETQLPLLSSDPIQQQLISLAYNLLAVDVNKYPMHFSDVQFAEDFLSQGDICQQWEAEQKQLVEDINRNLNALKTYIDTNAVSHNFTFLDTYLEPIKLSW